MLHRWFKSVQIQVNKTKLSKIQYWKKQTKIKPHFLKMKMYNTNKVQNAPPIHHRCCHSSKVISLTVRPKSSMAVNTLWNTCPVSCLVKPSDDMFVNVFICSLQATAFIRLIRLLACIQVGFYSLLISHTSSLIVLSCGTYSNRYKTGKKVTKMY